MAYITNNARGKIGKVLIYNGFRYQLNKRTNTVIYWQCWRRKNCTAKLQTNIFDLENDHALINVLAFTDHIHGMENDFIESSEVFQEMVTEIERDPTQPIRRVYNQVMERRNDEYPISFGSVQARLSRIRRANLPDIPISVDDVVILGEWAHTWSGDPFIRYQDNASEILVFRTQANYQTLQRCTTIFMDGTFKSCPSPYTQFVTIHGLYHGRVVPLVYGLLGNRTVGIYREMLQHVKTEILNLTGNRFRPNIAVCDFESSLISAMHAELRHTAARGCYFHFTQSLWRKVQLLGLSIPYGQNRRLQKCIRKFMAIGYLPVAIVRINFQLYVRENETQQLCRRYPELREFIQYIEHNYIRPQGLYAPALWNVYDRNMDTRTNNHVEGFHHKWNRLVQSHHPSIWIFIRRLKDEQRNTETAIAAAFRGDEPPLRRRKWRTLERRIRRLKEDYQNGHRTVDEYWGALVHVIKNYV